MNEDPERSGAAVQDGDLGTVRLHDRVVHAQRVEGGEQVLNGVDGDPIPAQGGGVVLPGEAGEAGRNLHIHVAAVEANAVLGGGGPEAQAGGPGPGGADPAAAHGAFSICPIGQDV